MVLRDDIVAIICPDVHGRNFWEDVAEIYDGSVPFIFLGDYLDPYPDECILDYEAKETFEKIWDFKKKWGNNVVLLIGNHDMSYKNSFFRTCRFSHKNHIWFHDFLKENWDSFKISHDIIYNNKRYLFSHAGVHPTWLRQNNFEDKDFNSVTSDYIVSLFNQNEKSFNDISFYRGGYFDAGSPIWADIREFANLKLDYDINDSLIQIVGHTQLIKDKAVVSNVHCIDSKQLFVLTKEGNVEPYNKKEEEN